MFKLLTTFILSMSMLWTLNCFGQWQTYAPLGTLPMQYNSSFAGQSGGPRVSSTSMYWHNKNFNFDHQGASTVLSYDQFIPAMRTGIGVTTGYTFLSTYIRPTHNLPFDTYSSSVPFVNIAISPKLSINGKYTISPSIDFSYGVSKVLYTYNQVPVTDTIFDINRKQYGINSRAGLLFNTNKLYIGYTVNIIRRPIRSSYNNPINRHLKGDFESYLQLGYTFQRTSEADFSFTPQVVTKLSHYAQENKIYLGIEAYNLNFRYKQFIWGLNDGGIPSVRLQDTRLSEKTAVHIGWQTDRFRLMLTNSYKARRAVRDGYMYIGHLSLRYTFSKDHMPGRGW